MPVVLARVHEYQERGTLAVPRRTTYREDSANKKLLRSFSFVSTPFLQALCLSHDQITLAFEGILDSARNQKAKSLLRRLPDNHHRRRHRRADGFPTCCRNTWWIDVLYICYYLSFWNKLYINRQTERNYIFFSALSRIPSARRKDRQGEFSI